MTRNEILWAFATGTAIYLIVYGIDWFVWSVKRRKQRQRVRDLF